MNMIEHQAIRPDIDGIFLGILRQPLQIELSILRREKDILPVIPALGDMVRYADSDRSSDTWHKNSILRERPPVKNGALFPYTKQHRVH